MTKGDRGGARRRWVLAGVVSLSLHAALFAWWSGVVVVPGDGRGGDRRGGGEGSGGLGAVSVIEVQIDVDAPRPAGAIVPADDVAFETAPAEAERATARSVADPAGGGTGGGGGGAGGGSRGGEGLGSGEGSLPGVGARVGGTGSGTGRGGVVPPRPIEITWPDTRKLSHCVGLRIDVRIRVDAEGRVERVEPASTGLPQDCVRAALETAERIKFAPGTVAGRPAALWSQVTIDFEKKR